MTTGKEGKGEMRERATMWHYHIESNLYPHCVHWHGIDVLNTLMLCYDSISDPFPNASATTYYGDDIVGIAGGGGFARCHPHIALHNARTPAAVIQLSRCRNRKAYMCHTDSERGPGRQLCGSFDQKQKMLLFTPHVPRAGNAGFGRASSRTRLLLPTQLRSFSPHYSTPCATVKKAPYNLK